MSDPAQDQERTPWSFWVIITMAALYLLLRLVQGVAWVVERVG